MTPNWKPCATTRKKKELEDKRNLAKKELEAKAQVRRRDKRCRFPLCGCHKLGLLLKAWPEVSHQRHKGAGGNPDGSRSTTAGMIFLCKHRHQDGAVSRHKGTLRAVPLTSKGMDGPVIWEIRPGAVYNTNAPAEAAWIEVAREKAVQQLEELRPDQRDLLEKLGEMDL